LFWQKRNLSVEIDVPQWKNHTKERIGFFDFDFVKPLIVLIIIYNIKKYYI